jgi:hypothetical protein
MPNWVNNWVSIGGKPEDVEAFRAKISAPRPYQKTVKVEGQKWEENVEGEWVIDDKGEAGDFSFWNLIAPPQEHWVEYFSTSGWKDGKKLGDTEWNWYAWNTANWDVKWDAGVEDFEDYGDGSLSYRIDTPWTTPMGVWKALAEQHPELSVEIRFEEEQGWGGIIEIGNGVLTIVKEWEIPESHADWIDQDQSCRACEIWDDGDFRYADCPKEEVNA